MNLTDMLSFSQQCTQEGFPLWKRTFFGVLALTVGQRFWRYQKKHTHIWTTHFILTQTDRERKSSISEQDVQAQIPFLAAGVRSELIFKGLCFYFEHEPKILTIKYIKLYVW